MHRNRWFIIGPCAAALALVIGLRLAMGQASVTAAAAGKNDPAAAVAAVKPNDGKLRIIAFGAHPDDCEIRVGGVAARWAAQGHHVKFVALTNGDIGHWSQAGGPLAQRRLKEVQNAAAALGIQVQVLDIHDGELMVDLETRKTIVRLIRDWKADLVLSHRPNDYHPDHRNTGLLVRDAAFMCIVPYFCPDTPYLNENPVFMYYYDRFTKPYPFTPDVVVSIDAVMDRKLAALAGMESQFLEGGCCPKVKAMPTDREAGLEKVRAGFSARFKQTADEYRDALTQWYGRDKGTDVKYAEAFEVSEYGAKPDPKELRRLFPFFD